MSRDEVLEELGWRTDDGQEVPEEDRPQIRWYITTRGHSMIATDGVNPGSWIMCSDVAEARQ